MPAQPTTVTLQLSPPFQRQLAIDETNESPSPDKRFQLGKRKSTPATKNTTDSSANGPKNQRSRGHSIELDPLEYMLDAFENCIYNILLMPSHMQSFIHIRLYRQMFSYFARQKHV